jgi:hypothetical protein
MVYLRAKSMGNGMRFSPPATASTAARHRRLGFRRVGCAHRIDLAPPRHDSLGLRRLDRLAQPRHQQRHALRRTARQQGLGGFVPGMERQAEGAPVHRQERTAAEQPPGFERVVRAEVDVAPRRVEGADLEHHQVEGPEPRADVGVLRGESGVAAEEDRMPRPANDHRGPQGGVAVLQAAAREMLRWRRRHAEPRARHGVRLPPVELDDAFGRHVEGLEVRADTQRGDERHAALREGAHRRVVQVVVVVVRHHHEIDRRQRIEGDRHRLEALRSGQLRRRSARAPDRVGQHAAAVDLDQHRGMSEPGGAQPAVGRACPERQRIQRRQGCARHPSRTAAQEIAQRRPLGGGIAQARRNRVKVAKAVAGPARRSLHALEAQAVGLPAE